VTELDTGCILHCQPDAHVMPFTRYSNHVLLLKYVEDIISEVDIHSIYNITFQI